MPRPMEIGSLCGSGLLADLAETFGGECIVTAAAMAVEVIDPKGERHMCTFWDEDSSLSTSVGLAVVFHKAAMDAVREVDGD